MQVKLMPEYECYPIWLKNSDDLFENIPPRELPISENLANKIMRWSELYELTYDKNNPADSGFLTNETEMAFKLYGKKLTQKLIAELGTKYDVISKF